MGTPAKQLPEPLVVLGCYHDHDPNAASLQGGEKYVGARLLKYGMPKCSGQWGCGTGAKAIKDCLPWPATLEACDGKKMEPV